MSQNLVIVPSPHLKDKATTSSVMLDVIIALIPTVIASAFLFGPRTLLLTAVCVGCCVAFEYLFCMVTKRESTIRDLSACVTGVLLAMNLPVSFPLWMAVIGCFVAIVIAKQLFGGIGQNFANPALVGRIVLFVSFAQYMTRWETSSGLVVASATPLGLLNQGSSELPSYLTLLFGVHGGVLGETCALTLIIGGLYLVWRKVITPTIPLVYIGCVFLFSFALGVDPLYQILSGGLMLGAIFMATDYTTSPVTERGKAIFAVGCALITVVIRLYGSYAEGVSFAILLMNILTPHIDNLTRNVPFGGKPAKSKK